MRAAEIQATRHICSKFVQCQVRPKIVIGWVMPTKIGLLGSPSVFYYTTRAIAVLSNHTPYPYLLLLYRCVTNKMLKLLKFTSALLFASFVAGQAQQAITAPNSTVWWGK